MSGTGSTAGALLAGGIAAALVLAGCTSALPTPSPARPAPSASLVTAPTSGSAAPTASGSVATGTPSRIRIPETGFDVRTLSMAIADSGQIDPPGFADVYWITDRGSAPGTNATDTTYFSCHTNHSASVADVPCNALSESVRVGQHVVVTNASGQITYRVAAVRQVPRTAFADDRVWDVTPGRLVWVTCYLENNQRTDFNLVIEADVVR
jgi:hypothetical protein